MLQLYCSVGTIFSGKEVFQKETAVSIAIGIVQIILFSCFGS